MSAGRPGRREKHVPGLLEGGSYCLELQLLIETLGTLGGAGDGAQFNQRCTSWVLDMAHLLVKRRSALVGAGATAAALGPAISGRSGAEAGPPTRGPLLRPRQHRTTAR